MIAPWLFERIVAWGDAPALVWNDAVASYAELAELADRWQEKFEARGLKAGEVVALEGSFSPNACAALIALVRLGAIIAPLTPLMRTQRDQFLDIAEARLLVEFDEADAFSFREFERTVSNAVTQKLIARGHPGLIIFSSGSTGSPKAILHDFASLL
ncbi:MAG TPA: AMP-binding protein, partial [Polyangiaceae bacterium]